MPEKIFEREKEKEKTVAVDVSVGRVIFFSFLFKEQNGLERSDCSVSVQIPSFLVVSLHFYETLLRQQIILLVLHVFSLNW